MNVAGSIRIVDRGEPLTVREFREMAESRAFQLVLAKIDKMIDAERGAIEKADDVDCWRRSQGAIRALRTVRELPSIIEGELGKR